MCLIINRKEYRIDKMVIELTDDTLSIDFKGLSDNLSLNWNIYYFRLEVDDKLEEVENPYRLYKVLWDIKQERVRCVNIDYIYKEMLAMYRSYVYNFR